MEQYLLPLVTVTVSGLFGLAVALMTWSLANQREKRKLRQDILVADFRNKESFYVTLLATYDRKINLIAKGLNDSLIEEMTLNSAKAQLISPKSIIVKLEDVNNELYKWSNSYKKGMPKKIGESSFGLVSNLNFQHNEDAEKHFPVLAKSIQELVKEIRLELALLRKELSK